MKAAERPCRSCGNLIPAQPSGPGRPKVFCSARCRRSWHYDRERERELEAQRFEWERNRYELEKRHYGKREADRRAKERAERRG